MHDTDEMANNYIPYYIRSTELIYKNNFSILNTDIQWVLAEPPENEDMVGYKLNIQ